MVDFPIKDLSVGLGSLRLLLIVAVGDSDFIGHRSSRNDGGGLRRRLGGRPEARRREALARGDSERDNGVSTNGVTPNFMFFDRGTFWVLPLTYQKCQGEPFFSICQNSLLLQRSQEC